MKYLIVLGYRDSNTGKSIYTTGFCIEAKDWACAEFLAREKEIEYLYSIGAWDHIMTYQVCSLQADVNIAIAKALPWEVVYQECLSYKEVYYQ